MSRFAQKIAWVGVLALVSVLPACLSDPPTGPGNGGGNEPPPQGPPFQLQSVAFGDGAFIAAGGERFDVTTAPRLFRSTDGTTWDEITITESSGISGVAFGNGRFVIVGGSPFFPGSPTRTLLQVSTDAGVTWAPAPSNPNWVYRDLVFDGADFYALILDDAIGLNAHRVVSAVDGEDWDVTSVLIASNPTLAYEAGRFLLWNQGVQAIATSTNGSDFTAFAIADLNRIYFAGHDGDRFVGTGGFDCCSGSDPEDVDFFSLTSTDATTWTATANPSGPFILDVASNNDIKVALGTTNKALVTGAIYSSPDGVEWTQEVLVEDVFSGDVFFGNGRFIVVSGKEIHSSTDGLNWTTVNVDTN